MSSAVGITRLSSLRCLQPIQRFYVCSICRRRTLRQRIANLQAIRSASSTLPFTERLRRKLWGTDNPPGQEDPYGGPGFFERRRRRQGAQEEIDDAQHDQPEILEPAESSTIAARDLANRRTPLRWSVAEQDAEQEDPSFVPAETWDGLDRVGERGHWSEKPPHERESFQPFLAAYGTAATREDILSSLHQAVVEVLTTRDAEPSLLGRLDHTPYPSDALASISSTLIEADNTRKQMVLRYTDSARDSILQAIIDGSGTTAGSLTTESEILNANAEESGLEGKIGLVRLEEPKEVRSELKAGDVEDVNFSGSGGVQSINHVAKTGSQEVVEESQPRQRTTYPVTSLDFLSIPVDDLPIQFAIVKRLSQLTGHRIPDPVLTTSNTLLPIYNYLVQQGSRKATKLADQLVARQDLTTLSNVTVMTRRQTSIDKDKRLGRWKVIEAELRSKGLPTLIKSRA